MRTHTHTHTHIDATNPNSAPLFKDFFEKQTVYIPTPIDVLTKKIDQSIRLLKAYSKWRPLTLAYSGGKDSDICLHLCKMANIPVTVVHNCTTIDYPGTLAYCKSRGAIINHPKNTFFQLVAKKGLPSMFRRFCCSYLKEQYIGPTVILGIRSSESIKRAIRYKCPSECRLYSKNERTEQVLPIIHWDADDIIQFTKQEHLIYHPHYYVNGIFDVSRRVGCIGCPLQGDRGRGDFLNYPKFFRRYCISYQQYVKTHKCVEGIYQDIMWNLFYSNHKQAQYEQTFNGLFTPLDARLFLQDYFHVELPQ